MAQVGPQVLENAENVENRVVEPEERKEQVEQAPPVSTEAKPADDGDLLFDLTAD